MELYLNGWCVGPLGSRRHRMCPDNPDGGLRGNDRHWWYETHRCSCSCHRDDGQATLEEAQRAS